MSNVYEEEETAAVQPRHAISGKRFNLLLVYGLERPDDIAARRRRQELFLSESLPVA